MSSSGLVPFPSSKRDENEYGPSNAPLPSFIVPLPSLRVPSHTADPVRVAIVLSPLVVDRSRFASDADERNAFSAFFKHRAVRLSEAKHLWLLLCSGSARGNQRFFASLRMTVQAITQLPV